MEINHKGPKSNESKENEKTQENVIAFNNSKITNGESIKKTLKLIDEKEPNLNQIKIKQENKIKIREHKKRTYIDKLHQIKEYNDIFSNKYEKFFLSNTGTKRIHSNFLFKFRMVFASLKLYIISIINISFLLGEYTHQKNFLKFSEVTLKVKSTRNFQILSYYFFQQNKPYEIYIDNSPQDTITYTYNFNNAVEHTYTFKILWNISISSTKNMFQSCSQIIEIDLSKFDTSQITNMYRTFYLCSSLTSLNLNNFNTSLVDDMEGMFYQCSLLKSLDLSNFVTSKVNKMNQMFYGCSTLDYLNIPNFDTSKVNDMSFMFSGCYILSSLDLSNFDTSLVIDMRYMFNGCSKLNSINLLNFNTSQVYNMSYMFYGCSLLSKLNLSNFDTKS